MIDRLLATGLVPDPLIRFGIRRLLAERLRAEDPGSEEALAERLDTIEAGLRESPVALESEAANEQHYEVPTEFFQRVLGPRLKYSSAYFPEAGSSLEEAEVAMLEKVAERAQIEDGQEILDLGCGWGSMSFFLAERFPATKILSVSNSATQGRFIREQAERRGHPGIEVLTADVNRFDTDRRFDRVISVEMFEHVRNYQALLERIASWMRPDGKLFVHIFCHHRFAYPFEDRGPGDWMARYFFTGGLMPSIDLLPRFDEAVRLEESWPVGGEHYSRTSEAWLANMDAHRAEILPLFEQVYGPGQSRRWWVYWRAFFLACAELFGYRDGREWLVAHYRFARR